MTVLTCSNWQIIEVNHWLRVKRTNNPSSICFVTLQLIFFWIVFLSVRNSVSWTGKLCARFIFDILARKSCHYYQFFTNESIKCSFYWGRWTFPCEKYDNLWSNRWIFLRQLQVFFRQSQPGRTFFVRIQFLRMELLTLSFKINS